MALSSTDFRQGANSISRCFSRSKTELDSDLLWNFRLDAFIATVHTQLLIIIIIIFLSQGNWFSRLCAVLLKQPDRQKKAAKLYNCKSCDLGISAYPVDL